MSCPELSRAELRRPGPRARASASFAEIGSVPRRDRSSSVPRSVQFRTEIGSTAARPGGRGREAGFSARGGHFGTSPTAASSDSHRNVDLDGNEAVRRRESFPHERRIAPDRAAPGPTSTAGSYPTPHGRTQIHEVVPGLARSYLKAPLQYDPAPQRTTTRIHVRPREPGYDRPEVTAAGPVGRTTTRATAPPHDPPTAPDPTRPITPTPRPRPPTPTASRTARPSDNHHPPPAPSRTTPPHNHDKRTDLEPELNRSRRRRAGSGEPRCQASLTRLSMSSTLFMSRKRDTC